MKGKPFDGSAKPLSLISKIIAVVFLIGFSIFYFIFKGNPLTLSSALALVTLTIALSLIFAAVDASILLRNVRKLRQVILGGERILDSIEDKEKEKAEKDLPL